MYGLRKCLPNSRSNNKENSKNMKTLKVKFKKDTTITGVKFDYYAYHTYQKYSINYKKNEEEEFYPIKEGRKYFYAVDPQNHKPDYAPGGSEDSFGFISDLKIPKENIEWILE